MEQAQESPTKLRGSDAVPQTTGQNLREWITAAISAAIVAVALWLLIDTYQTGKVVPDSDRAQAQLDAFARQKDLLLYALASLGTVTGYYLGRVPAELHAQRAEGEAKASQAQAETAKENEESTKRKVKQSLRELKKKNTSSRFGATDAGASASQGGTLAEQIDALIDELD